MWAALVSTVMLMGFVGWATVRGSLSEMISGSSAIENPVASVVPVGTMGPAATDIPRVFVSSSQASRTPSVPENPSVASTSVIKAEPTKDWFALITTLGGPINPPGASGLSARVPTAISTIRPTIIARQPPPTLSLDVGAAIATAQALELTPTVSSVSSNKPRSSETPYVPEVVLIGETATPLAVADFTRPGATGPPPRPTGATTVRPTPTLPTSGATTTPIPMPTRNSTQSTPTVLSVQPEEKATSASIDSRASLANVSAIEATTSPTVRPSTRRTSRAAVSPRVSGAPTATPGPTRTPRPLVGATPWAGPIPTNLGQPRNGANKWGLGVYKDSNRAADIVRDSAPGVILLMDPSEGWARRIRQLAPNAFIVGRRFRTEVDQPLDFPEQRGEEFADWVAESAIPLRGVVDAWMSYNEVLGSQPNQSYSDYNRFQMAFARRLQNIHSIAAVAGNDGSGALEPDDYPVYFADSIRASRYFGVHAYSPPATNAMDVDAEWNAIRYRKIHDALERAGIRDKQMVITESGLGDGFRGGQATDEQMASGFAWFTKELSKDQYMIGHAAFGLFDATGNWARFDLTETSVAQLVSRILAPNR